MTEIVSDDINLQVYNTYVRQGSTWRRIFTWTDASGNAITLYGYTASMKVRKINPATFLTPYSVDSPVISISSSGGDIVFYENLGMIQVTITAADTASVTPGIYYYDLEVTSGDDVYKIVSGTFEVIGEATV